MEERKVKNIFWQAGLKNGILFVFYIATSFVLNEIVILGNDFISEATDSMLAGHEVNFGAFLMPLIVMVLAGTVVAYVKSLCGSNYSAKVQREVREKLGSHLLKLPYCYFDEKGTGSIMTKLISDVSEAGRFFS